MTARYRRSDLLLAWCGPAACALLGASLLIAGLLQPPSPHAGSRAIVEYWSRHVDARRTGLVVMEFSGGLFVGYLAAIAGRLRKIEGPGSPAALVALGGGVLTGALIMGSLMLMTVIVFDLGRPPQITLALTQVAWIPFVALWAPSALQAAAVALVVLGDRRPDPVLPRWCGWLAAWYVFASLGAALTGFFTTGAFAWNGFFSFYVEGTFLINWYLAMFVAVRRSILDERDAAAVA